MIGVFEYRVVFHSFRSYIVLAYPWNVVVVTIAIFIFAFAALLFFTGDLRRIGLPVSLVFTIIGSSCAALVLKLSLLMSVSLLLSAVFFIVYYFNKRPEVYLISVGCATYTFLFFLRDNFFFLDFYFQTYNISLKLLCVFGVILFFISVTLMAVPITNLSPMMLTLGVQPLLLIQAFLLAFVEQILYEQMEDMYPAYLVLATSTIGIWVTLESDFFNSFSFSFSFFIYSIMQTILDFRKLKRSMKELLGSYFQFT